MTKVSFIDFLKKNIWFFLVSLVIIIPLSFIFERSTSAMYELSRTKGFLASDNFILTYLYPLFISILVVFGISYNYAIKNQLAYMGKYLKLIEYNGKESKAISKVLIGFYGLIFLITIIFGFLLGALDIFYIIIPSLLLLISFISMLRSLKNIR
ncbi:hypothetical protein [Anaerococcus sp. AGMB09787]|uniref:hypothetical protein n=1 Tax=Anaerococcus sp. AGMB09787 TaxID=2922869 RepID=UPI001FB0320E|nr:hypothetical protein [Anaerococcus sp. AGMB09787]